VLCEADRTKLARKGGRVSTGKMRCVYELREAFAKAGSIRGDQLTTPAVPRPEPILRGQISDSGGLSDELDFVSS
jgi:hypothetical protein